MSGRRRNGREENRPGGGGKEAPGRLLRRWEPRDNFVMCIIRRVRNSNPAPGLISPSGRRRAFHPAIAEAVARELPDAGADVRAGVTALLAQFVSQGMVS